MNPERKKIKKYFLVLLSVLCSFRFAGDDITDRIGVAGPLVFDKTQFGLAWTERPRDNYYIQEYLPPGEKNGHFSQMLTIHLFVTELNVKEAVRKKTEELDIRKKTDPTCNYMITASPDGKEFMVDFLLGESKNDRMTIAEFNVYRYRQVGLSNGKKGILVYAFSKRAYGDDITAFYKSLNRTKFLNAMIGAEIPVVKISDQ